MRFFLFSRHTLKVCRAAWRLKWVVVSSMSKCRTHTCMPGLAELAQVPHAFLQLSGAYVI
jgi:hypothetical protein